MSLLFSIRHCFSGATMNAHHSRKAARVPWNGSGMESAPYKPSVSVSSHAVTPYALNQS